ncbi:MAG: class I SAM-dependent methyltransferase [Candidatus Hodarchaeales archaeon]|jgi:SAM-dependent methyltransferase
MSKSPLDSTSSDFITNYVKSIQWDKRLSREIPFLLKIFQENNNYKNILDLGCGPGFHAKKLAEKDLHVVGVDIDEGAINYANENVLDESLALKFRKGNFIEDPSVLEGSHDAIFSLGNALMIIWSINEIEPLKIFSILANALNPSGGLFFQILNSNNPRKGYVVSKNARNEEIKSNQVLVKHFLPVKDDLYTQFMHIRWKDGDTEIEKEENEVGILKLIPVEKLEVLMREAGFIKFQYFENYQADTFKPNESDSLLCFAQK